MAANEIPGNQHVPGWFFSCCISLGTVCLLRPFPELCPMLIASSGTASLPPPPNWAGMCLLAPFSSPINLGFFLYSLQAPTGPALFQGILEARRWGTLMVPLFLERQRPRGRCLEPVKPGEAWRAWVRGAVSHMTRHRGIKRSCQEQIPSQARDMAPQHSLPREGGCQGSGWVQECSYTNAAVKHQSRAVT